MKNEVNRALVAEKKKIYNSPLVEAMPIMASRQLMETSIPLPPDMTPERRKTEVF